MLVKSVMIRSVVTNFDCMRLLLSTREAACFIILVDSVCMYVLCLSNSNSNFQKPRRRKSYLLHIRYISRQYGSGSYMKVIGSRS